MAVVVLVIFALTAGTIVESVVKPNSPPTVVKGINYVANQIKK